MQIHELNNFTGTLGAGSYVAIDDGNDTGKVSTQQILANTEARIDNIIAGEAPSAEEIVDARLGADGVTYTSLGTAIRTQFTDVKSAFSEEFTIAVPAGTSSNYDVDLVVPYNGYKLTIVENTAYQDDQQVTVFDDAWNATLMTTGTTYNRTTQRNIVRIHASRLKTSGGVATGGTIKFAFVSLPQYDRDNAFAGFKSESIYYAKKLPNLSAHKLPAPIVFEQGNITDGVPSQDGSTTRVRTKDFILTDDIYAITVSSTRDIILYAVYYDEDYEYVTAVGIGDTDDVILNRSYKYFKLTVLDVTGGLFNNPLKASDVANYVTVYSFMGDDALRKAIDFGRGGHLDTSLFAIGSLNQGVYYDSSTYPYRVATPYIMSFPYDIVVSAKSGYMFAYHEFTSSNSAGVIDSGWQLKKVIPKGTVFRMTISKNPEGTQTPNIAEYVNAIDINLYDPFDYSFGDGQISFKKQRYSIFDTGIYATPSADITIATVSNLQGFGFCNGVIFQCYSDNVVELIDYNTKEKISDQIVNFGHGNCICFTNDYKELTDEFPLAIVSDTIDNPKAYLVRFSRSTSTIEKTFAFPQDKAGAFANVMFDALNNIIYTVGYKRNTYLDPTNNNMIFAKWDYSNLTDNGNGTYTPAFVENFSTPFMLTMQAPAFFNGKLFVVSSNWQDTNTLIYVVDPISKRICNVISDFPSSIKNVELEGIFFVDFGTEYRAILKTNDGTASYKIMCSNI